MGMHAWIIPQAVWIAGGGSQGTLSSRAVAGRHADGHFLDGVIRG